MRIFNPLESLETAFEVLNRLGRNFEHTQARTTAEPVYVPPADIVKKGDATLLALEIPGADIDNVDISLKDDVLTIAGELKPVFGDVDKYIQRQRWTGRFSKSFNVDPRVDYDSIAATFRNGILILTVPDVKEEQPPVRKIKIQTSDSDFSGTEKAKAKDVREAKSASA